MSFSPIFLVAKSVTNLGRWGERNRTVTQGKDVGDVFEFNVHVLIIRLQSDEEVSVAYYTGTPTLSAPGEIVGIRSHVAQGATIRNRIRVVSGSRKMADS